MAYKDIVFNDNDPLSDKIIALNNNDLFLKEYADRITQGHYVIERLASKTNLGTSDSTLLNLEKFWVPLQSRMVKIVVSGFYYSLYTGGTNNFIITIELDGTQIYQQYSPPVYNASGSTISLYTWSDVTAIADVDAGEHTVTVKAKKLNAGTKVDLTSVYADCFVIDIGQQRAAEA